MNRKTKRLVAKQQSAMEKERLRRAQSLRAPAEREPLRKRIPKFVREARNELKRVAWPTRYEVFVYTLVVLIAVSFVTTMVFGLDYVFGRGILEIYSQQ